MGKQRKIVLVTAGGHISSFHAAMKEMHETLEDVILDDNVLSYSKGKRASEVFGLYGARGGVSGLNKGDIVPINYNHLEEDRAGSMIGSDREHLDIDRVIDVVKGEDIFSVIMMGGDNHLGEALKGYQVGLPFIGWPKTMDGDSSTFIPLGWETAVTTLTRFVRHHYNSAITNRRVFYTGYFGRDTDWITCGVSAYSNTIAIPGEQSYGWDYILGKIAQDVEENKRRFGVPFSVVPFSENTHIDEIKEPPKEHQERDKHGEIKLQPKWIALELDRLTKQSGYKTASQVYEYTLRDFPPTETDKRLSKMAARESILMTVRGEFGKCPIFTPDGDFYEVIGVSLNEACKKRRVMDYDFFDYEELRTSSKFLEVYDNLFRDSLGNPPKREELVYKNMI